MNERRLLKRIKDEAKRGGLDCEVGRAILDAKTLGDVLKLANTPKGREGLTTLDFPSKRVWAEVGVLKDIKEHGVYVSESVQIKGEKCVTLYECSGSVECAEVGEYHITLINSTAKVIAKNYAVVIIDKDKNSKLEAENVDGTAIIIE